MALKFKCTKCGKDIIVKFLKAGEVAKCNNCETYNIVPTNALETDEESTWDAAESSEPKQKPKVELRASSMSNLLESAISVLVISALVILVGQWYTSTHGYVAVGAMFEDKDAVHSLVLSATTLGLLAFLVGIGLLIGALVQRSNTSSFQGMSRPESGKNQAFSSLFCPQCGTKLQTDDKFCANCGSHIRS